MNALSLLDQPTFDPAQDVGSTLIYKDQSTPLCERTGVANIQRKRAYDEMMGMMNLKGLINSNSN